MPQHYLHLLLELLDALLPEGLLRDYQGGLQGSPFVLNGIMKVKIVRTKFLDVSLVEG